MKELETIKILNALIDDLTAQMESKSKIMNDDLSEANALAHERMQRLAKQKAFL